MVLVSLTEGIGLALLLPTLQVAGLELGPQVAAGRYAIAVSRGFTSLGLHPNLLLLLLIFVALVSLRAILVSIQQIGTYTVQRGFADFLRVRLYRAIANANWLFVTRSRSADFVHTLTSEVDRGSFSLSETMFAVSDAILLGLYLIVALFISAALTLTVLAAGVVLAIALIPRSKAVHLAGTNISTATDSLYNGTIEHVQSLKTAKTYGAQERNLEVFRGLTRRLSEASLEATRKMASVGLFFELGSAAILAAVLFVAIRVLEAPPAEILLLILIFVRVMPRFLSCHHHYRAFTSMLPSFDNVLAMEARCITATESDCEVGHGPALREGIRLEDVKFSYEAAGAPAIRDVSISIPAGKITAIVGPSGAGKSTIADIVMGLLIPDAGTVLVGGVPLSPGARRGWRDRIGYVAADTFLFYATVQENLLWARPDASDDELHEALRAAAAEEFVRSLPRGLDTPVGERGMTLSQGERQRLALARAMLRRPTLLILDEATNSLDSDNETRVMATIRGLQDVTTLLIGHRLSTVRWADLIYVMEDGAIAECGSWLDLSRRNHGRFRALCEAQGLNP